MSCTTACGEEITGCVQCSNNGESVTCDTCASNAYMDSMGECIRMY